MTPRVDSPGAPLREDYPSLNNLLFFYLFRAAPTAQGGSQARSLIGAAAAGLHHSHSHARSELRLQPTPQLMATPDS